MITTLKKQNGFTLVELAIVLVIVGLLIASILKGQEMIRNAQMQRTVTQAESFIAAHHTFQQNYGALPGDMINAVTRIEGCTPANNCANGDGNNIVGTPIDNAVGAIGGVENALYWKHLALANLITSVNIAAPTAPADVSFGESHPRTAIGGSGWNAITTVLKGGDYGGRGVVFQITGIVNTNSIGLSPQEAFYIGRVLDDANPNSGRVTAEWSSSSSCEEDTNNTYRTDLNTIECIVYVSSR